MPEMQSLDFNKLPESVRQQFVNALKSIDDDECPLIAQKFSLTSTLIWSIAAIVVVGLMVNARLQAGFGNVAHEDAWQGYGSCVFYILCIGAIAYSLLAIYRCIMLYRGLPFLPGWYLFPFALVDARTANLKLYDLAHAKQMNAVHKYDSNGRYRRTEFFFTFRQVKKQMLSVRDINFANSIFPEMNRRRALLQAALSAENMATVFKHDPFMDIRSGKMTANKIVAGETMAQHLPYFLKWRAAFAILVGLAIGMPLWYGRNLRSDDAAYEATKASKHELNYQQYLTMGHRHVQEIREALPRVAFEDVRRTRSVTQIRAVLRRYPHAGLDEDVKNEVHMLYLAAMEKFRAQAADADPTLVPFIEQLLAILETSGNSTVQLRFTRPTTDALAKMDERLAIYAARQGRTMEAAAPWFTPQSAAGREQRIIQGLQQGFAAIFPSDVMQISQTGQVDENRPLMDIAYQIDGSGHYYQSMNHETNLPDGKRIFVGLICKFAANVSLPGKDTGWHFDLSVLPPDTFQVEFKKSNPNDNEAPVDRIYSVMAERAFDELHVKMRNVLFRPGSDAYKKVLITRVK